MALPEACLLYACNFKNNGNDKVNDAATGLIRQKCTAGWKPLNCSGIFAQKTCDKVKR
jgi:hypothetical protein